MKVINYTNILRQRVVTLFKPWFDVEDKADVESVFDDFKENNTNYNNYIESMFICGYLYSNLVNYFDKNEEKSEDMEFFESFNSIEEFSQSLDYYTFKDLYADTAEFLEESYYSKRDYITKLEDNTDFLKKICPMFILDLFYYLNVFNTDEIKDTYYKNLSFLKEKDTAIEDTICIIGDTLNDLSYNDVYNYKYIVCELIENFYKYSKYLLDTGVKLEEEVVYIVEIAESNLDELIIMSYGNDVILAELIRGFLEYELLTKEQKNNIDKYFANESNKKSLNKIMTKTLKIRGELT